MAGSTEKSLGYRVKMLPDTNAVNSEIKKSCVSIVNILSFTLSTFQILVGLRLMILVSESLSTFDIVISFVKLYFDVM